MTSNGLAAPSRANAFNGLPLERPKIDPCSPRPLWRRHLMDTPALTGLQGGRNKIWVPRATSDYPIPRFHASFSDVFEALGGTMIVRRGNADSALSLNSRGSRAVPNSCSVAMSRVNGSTSIFRAMNSSTSRLIAPTRKQTPLATEIPIQLGHSLCTFRWNGVPSRRQWLHKTPNVEQRYHKVCPLLSQ